MAELDLTEELTKLVTDNGDAVAMHTKDCIIWKAEHKNCAGCPYELGCAKLVKLMLTMSLSNTYTPRDYSDFARMQNRITELQGKIMNAKTVEGLKTIPMA